jgi:hypothetical protein
MNNQAISTKIRQKPNTSEYILRTVNDQTSQSGNINKGPQTVTTRLVGMEKHSFHLDEDQLCKCSSFFDSALGGGFKESTEFVVGFFL